jgi:hypothetical protein
VVHEAAIAALVEHVEDVVGRVDRRDPVALLEELVRPGASDAIVHPPLDRHRLLGTVGEIPEHRVQAIVVAGDLHPVREELEVHTERDRSRPSVRGPVPHHRP